MQGAPAAAALPGPSRITYPSADPRRFRPHHEFLEDNTLDYFVPDVGPAHDRRLVFDAQVAPHLFLLNQWDKVEFQPGWTGGLVHSFAITFLTRLRMVRDRSAPVRPPSYMPRFDYQLFHASKTAADQVRIVELRLTPWGHHSNGQQYCSFVENPDGDPGTQPCLPVDPANPPTDKVNYRSGDFSTSFFVVGAHYARLFLDRNRWERCRLAGGVLFEGNPGHWGPGNISPAMSRLYGPWRLKLELEARYHADAPLGWSWMAGTASASASTEIIWKTAPGIPGDREIAEVSHVLDRLLGAGVFLRFLTGQDPQNLLFASGRTTMLQFGIIWRLSAPLQYTFQRV